MVQKWPHSCTIVYLIYAHRLSSSLELPYIPLIDFKLKFLRFSSITIYIIPYTNIFLHSLFNLQQKEMTLWNQLFLNILIINCKPMKKTVKREDYTIPLQFQTFHSLRIFQSLSKHPNPIGLIHFALKTLFHSQRR